MTIERSMFPPRNATRRGFLTVIAGGAAAAATVSPQPALAFAGRPLDSSKASPALRAAVIALAESSEAVEAAKALVVADDAKIKAWVAENPRPHSRRGKKRWQRKYGDARFSIMEKSWDARMNAETDFRKKQMAVAEIQAADMDELGFIAAVAAVYDRTELATGARPIISYSVAMDFLRLNLPQEVRS
ncbi:hypothetical protein KMZ68_13780 [Bradyrhizobium sediminis]|uniref:Uncharacterized protein n=1 Tax=Bradyrhizobium sediminis TaxID=2840469 RepID=A0A975NL98_9BRAD|nr:hypothetical protein [Bradyrhizobium sediminis]QWG16114.1 hypothetical protein KMZ68_13780 [Bradyrhizobium sediminis]